MGKNPNIVVLDVDAGKSTGAIAAKSAYPERYISLGIAEQNMMGFAAGLAACGKIPFAATFAVFTSMRAVEQFRQAICLTNLNVKIAGTHSGLETGPDGATHQSVEDLAIIRAIPNVRLLVPGSPNASVKLTRLAAETAGPVYLRFSKDPTEELYSETEEFPLGGSKDLRHGDYAAVFAYGNMVSVALAAADMLEKSGKKIRVIDMYSIKPIDEEAIIKAARETKGLVTIEDHSVIGGLGGAVAEVSSLKQPARVIRIGIQDRFGRTGAPAALYQHYGLSAESIVQAVETL
jgi:transketolase